jgi:uncharacterized protein YjgD (DUF1641 family)
MANPLPFKPIPADPRTELQRRLAAAPTQHAEALLVAWDILETAHDQGILDALHGLLGAKDAIAGKLAEYAKTTEGIAVLRNILAAAKIIAALDPETLSQLSKNVTDATQQQQHEQKSPSLWQLFKRTNTEDSRRGLSFLTLLLSNLGKSLKGQ